MVDPVRVPLTQGYEALIDVIDAPRVLAQSWRVKFDTKNPSKAYGQRSFRVDGKSRTESLHRFIMGAKPGDGVLVDHRNGDGLDNQRHNLRATDARGNATNVTRSKRQKAGGYKGVTWSKPMGKWQASICAGEVKPNGKRRQLYLGCFVDPVDAAKAYDTEARAHFGEFACCNFELTEVQRAG